MMVPYERIFKIGKVIFLAIIPKISVTKFHQNWTTKSRVIHVRISVPKQYQMMMSSVARVKSIKTKVIFRYHTKHVSNQVSSTWNHKIGDSFKGFKSGKRITNWAGISNQTEEIPNRGRDYKWGQEGFQIGTGIINRYRTTPTSHAKKCFKNWHFPRDSSSNHQFP